MAKVTDLLLDNYERRARLTPGLFSIAPVAALVLALSLESNPLISGILSVLTVGGGAYLLSVITANLGRRNQAQLWKSWGGTPTAQLLRVESNVSSSTQRKIWRNAVQVLTGVKLQTEKQEKLNVEKSDEIATAAVGQVRGLTHNEQYPLVGKENAQYGLERNLYGSRWLGRSLSAICLILLVIAYTALGNHSTSLTIGIVTEGILLVLWFIIPSENRTKEAAFRYGEQLLQAVVIESKGK